MLCKYNNNNVSTIMSEVKVNLIEVECDEIKERIDIDLRFHETIIEKILWKINAFQTI